MSERILMIEDDARLAQMVSEYLADHGFQVVHRGTAADGRDSGWAQRQVPSPS